MINNIFKFVLVAAFFSSMSCNLMAYDVNNAIADTINNNPDLASKREAIEVQRSSLYTSMTKFLPEVLAQSKNTDVDVRKNSGTSTTTRDNRTRSVTVTQNIFNGFQDFNAFRQAEHALKAEEYKYRIDLNQKVLKGIEAYQSLIISRENLKVTQKNHEVLLRQRELMEKNFELGNEKITKVHAVRSRLAEAKSFLQRAKGDIKTSEAEFKQIIGIDPPAKLDEIDVSAVVTPKTLDELINIALLNNPSIKFSEQQLDAAKKGVYIAAGTFSPKANFQLKHENSRSVFEGGAKSRIRDNSYVLSLDIPLFQKGAEYTEFRRAKHQEYGREYTLEETKNAVSSEASAIWSEFHSRAAAIEAGEEAVYSAQKAVDAAYEEAKIGTETSIFVIDRQADLFASERNLLTEKLRYVVALYRLYQLMGSIDNVQCAA